MSMTLKRCGHYYANLAIVLIRMSTDWLDCLQGQGFDGAGTDEGLGGWLSEHDCVDCDNGYMGPTGVF
jgi:hypothetical protein